MSVRTITLLVLIGLITSFVLSACDRVHAPPTTGHTGQADKTTPAQPAPQTSHPEIAADASQPRRGKAATAQLHVLQAPRTTVRPIPPQPPLPPTSHERYGDLDGNPVQRVAQHPVSTFSIDVDTGSYTNVRRLLNAGRLPPADAVRTEEFINYFDYHYPAPHDPSQPFSVTTTVAATPWNADTHLLRIGIQGWLPPGDLPPANLVFLVDVSGSMRPANKLPLLKSALKLLARQLDADDRVSLVVYAGRSEVVLKPTPGDQTAKILRAIDSLSSGGSTNGSAGIRDAYSLARQAYIDDGINRVILATDGDFNVGTVDFDALVELVKHQQRSGIALTTLGFGTGNYNARLIEQLADRGNGNYAYIDNLSEAQRVLVDNRAATLRTIAKDVKIQIEFNPAVVAEYRLIGYENRKLDRADFSNDKVDAGEIGAGHDVTALYEIALVGSDGTRMAPLRYQERDQTEAGQDTGELAFVRLRYKLPDSDSSRLIEMPVETASLQSGLAATGEDFRFAAAVAAFGQLLRGGTYTNDYGYDDVLALARDARGADTGGWRGGFLQLVQLADALSGPEDVRQPTTD